MSSDKVEINSGDSLADQLSRTEYLRSTEQSIRAASPYIALKENGICKVILVVPTGSTASAEARLNEPAKPILVNVTPLMVAFPCRGWSAATTLGQDNQ